MRPITSWLENRDAHDNLARVQPPLKRAECKCVLRLNIEAAQWEACDDCRCCTGCEQREHAVHPRRVEYHVTIECNGTI
eukprot:3325733-Prymnesium_polylepis.4